jgi:hypothetical protein
LVPCQATTGGKPRLLRISKRDNSYLRMLLIHGARTVLPGLAEKDTPVVTQNLFGLRNGWQVKIASDDISSVERTSPRL